MCPCQMKAPQKFPQFLALYLCVGCEIWLAASGYEYGQDPFEFFSISTFSKRLKAQHCEVLLAFFHPIDDRTESNRKS